MARHPTPASAAAFRPMPGLANGHAQTVFAGLLRRPPAVRMRRERVELPDGDFVDADWSAEKGLAAEAPVAILLHGLEGSSASPYMAGMMRALGNAGIRSVALHFRGCSGPPNRRRVGYHSGWTDDLRHFLALLRARQPRAPLAAVGFSLGGNVLLKLLGEQGAAARLDAAAAVSVPFDLSVCADNMSGGISRLYQRYLVRRLRAHLERKRRFHPVPVDLSAARAARSFRAFDEAVTAPLHGFRDAGDYYAQVSSRRFLKAVRVPTRIIQAADDPFLGRAALPTVDELPEAVRFELTERGGHLGFVGGTPARPVYHLEHRIPAWLVRIFRGEIQD
jgi:predicted alpha/beta-fold hydrolase